MAKHPEKLAAHKDYKLRILLKLLQMDAKRRASHSQRTQMAFKTGTFSNRTFTSSALMLNKHGVESWHVDHIVPLQGKTYLAWTSVQFEEWCQAQ